eukprot:scaffold21060_cov112-Isochrysis_galbana.AAC.4
MQPGIQTKRSTASHGGMTSPSGAPPPPVSARKQPVPPFCCLALPTAHSDAGTGRMSPTCPFSSPSRLNRYESSTSNPAASASCGSRRVAASVTGASG